MLLVRLAYPQEFCSPWSGPVPTLMYDFGFLAYAFNFICDLQTLHATLLRFHRARHSLLPSKDKERVACMRAPEAEVKQEECG